MSMETAMQMHSVWSTRLTLLPLLPFCPEILNDGGIPAAAGPPKPLFDSRGSYSLADAGVSASESLPSKYLEWSRQNE